MIKFRYLNNNSYLENYMNFDDSNEATLICPIDALFGRILSLYTRTDIGRKKTLQTQIPSRHWKLNKLVEH